MQEVITENRILKGVGGFYYVNTADGVLECRARGIFRKQRISPLPGDLVRLEKGESGSPVIAQLLPRKNMLIRPPVANLDLLFIVASTLQPAPNHLLLDRLCAIAVDKGITPVILVTKVDLADARLLVQAYEKSGIQLLTAAPDDPLIVGQLQGLISGRVCTFTGNSGVGKSTLLNRLLPGLGQQTGQISKKLGRGRHTTRQVEFFSAFGGLVADTPGFSSLEMERANPILKEELQHCFPEFARYLPDCRFTSCSHRKEKGCAVRAAVQAGQIHPSRYESYLAMYEEASGIKEWEQNGR